jgi:hypothetical protein
MPEAPVRLTETSGCRNRGQLRLQVVGGGDHRRRFASRAGDDDCRMAVGRDGGPRRGAGRTECGYRTENCLHLVDDGSKGRRLGGEGRESGRTTIGAELERPAKFCSISERAETDSDPFACQPAPERTVSTRGAKIAEHDGDDAPRERDQPQVIGRPPAEPP